MCLAFGEAGRETTRRLSMKKQDLKAELEAMRLPEL